MDSFLKAYQSSETKGFFPYDWVTGPDSFSFPSLPPYDAFYNRLKSVNSLEADYLKYQNLLQSQSPSSVLKQMKLTTPPLNGRDNYAYLQSIWECQGMTSVKDFARWYTNKDVVPTLEALQKMLHFYHNKNIDMTKVAKTLPGLANIILHQSTDALVPVFCAKDKDLDDTFRNEIVGGAAIVFTRFAKVGTSFIRESNNLVQTIVGVDASQLYPFAMSQSMPVGVYTRWKLDAIDGKFKIQRNGKLSYENRVMSFLKKQRPSCNIISIVTTGTQYEIGPYKVDGICLHCNTIFEANGCWFHFHDCKSYDPEFEERVDKKRKYEANRNTFLKSKGYKIFTIWECQFWKDVKSNKNGLKQFMKSNFPFKPALSEIALINKIRSGELFGVIECDVYVPEEKKKHFEDFPPIFKNTNVSREDIGDHMRNVAEEEGLLKRPQRMTISSYFQKSGLFITPLLKYYMTHGLIVENVKQFIEYDQQRCFQPFVQSVVDARRNGDTNPNSAVLAETMKLIGNSAYGRQIMDRSRHTKTVFSAENGVDRLINNKLFTNLNEISSDVYEATMMKSSVTHSEPIVLGFFILQYSKLRMLELVYNFFARICDRDLYQFIEMDTDSLYMALGRETITECIRPEMRSEWDDLHKNDCRDDFRADNLGIFFPRSCCSSHIQHDKREPGLFKEEWRGHEMIALCSKTYCGVNLDTNAVKFSSKGLNKDNIEEPLAKYRKVLETEVNEMSTNRGFRCVNNSMVTYSLRKKGLAYFYPKRRVLDDGISTLPLDI